MSTGKESVGVGERERQDGGRDRLTEAGREKKERKETDRQTDRQAHRQTERQRQTEKSK